MPDEPQPKYNCTQQTLYSILNTAWDNCLANLTPFTNYKAKYTVPYISGPGTGKKAAIVTAQTLPDDDARQSPAEIARVNLIGMNDTCTLDFQKLKGYIEDGFPKAQWKSRFEAAGQNYYKKAAEYNWENTIGMNTNMNAFIALPANNVLLLTPGGMPVGFPAQVTGDTGTFATNYNTMKTAQETGVGTGSKITANNLLYDDMLSMFRDAHRGVFPTDAEKLKLFTFIVLKKMVSPPGSASLKITLQQPDNTLVPGIPVTIKSEDGTPIIVNSDEKGEASYPGIDPDRYRVTANVPTFKPIDKNKDVDTGVNARLVIKLEAI